MARCVLLLGRKGIVVDKAQAQLDDLDVNVLVGTSLKDVQNAFDGSLTIDHVFMGAGIDLETRLEIVRGIFQRSDATCVHLKDAKSGPKGFLPFVRATLKGLGEASTMHLQENQE